MDQTTEKFAFERWADFRALKLTIRKRSTPSNRSRKRRTISLARFSHPPFRSIGVLAPTPTLSRPTVHRLRSSRLSDVRTIGTVPVVKQNHCISKWISSTAARARWERHQHGERPPYLCPDAVPTLANINADSECACIRLKHA
jgi:hypothetical protein